MIVVTGARAGLERTTMTLCLAREALRRGKSVALVDLDHDQPAMLERIGIEFDQGIESLHRPGVTPAGICVSASEEGVSLFPSASAFSPTQCAEPESRELLQIAEANHDLVFVDASREVADILVSLRDIPRMAVIMVNDPDTHQATLAFIDWMKEKEAWTLGVIENFAA